jgi:hypothetical protein
MEVPGRSAGIDSAAAAEACEEATDVAVEGSKSIGGADVDGEGIGVAGVLRRSDIGGCS